MRRFTTVLSLAVVLLVAAPRAWGVSVYEQTVVASSPIAYWRLGESGGTTAADRVGSRNGTYLGGYTLGSPGAITGDTDTAVALDGSSGRIDLGPVAWSGTTFSFVAWIRPNDVTGRRNIFHLTQAFGTAAVLQLGFRLRDGLVMVFDGTTERFASNSLVTAGAWTQVAVTFEKTGNSANYAIYLNGALDAAGSASYGPPTGSSTRTLIGAHWIPNTPLNLFFDGSLDEIAVYNRILTDSDILQQYEVGIGEFSVPEPGVAVVLLLGFLAMAAHRSKRGPVTP